MKFIEDLAPKGVLRVAINVGNGVLVKKLENGGLSGISVHLAKKLASLLGLEYKLIAYESAGEVANSALEDVWDVAFLAIDEKRAKSIYFTSPYIVINGNFLVRENSNFYTFEDVDKKGVEIVVGKNAAYDLYLSRHIKNATLIRSKTTPLAFPKFVEENRDVVAGIKEVFTGIVKNDSTYRLIDKSFMSIRQAMALPLTKDEKTKEFLSDFIKDINGTDFVKKHT